MNDKKLIQITRRKKFAEEEFWMMMSELREQQWGNLSQPQLPIEDLPYKAAKNFVTPLDAPVPDCLTCGACCKFVFVIGLNPTDTIPAENIWDVMQRWKENQEIVIDRFLRRDAETLHCAALDTTTASGKAVCQIYEQRPRSCHNFEAGSDKCHGLRRLYGFDPPLTVMETLSALQTLESKAASPVKAEKIRRVKIVEKAETDELTIMAVMEDGSDQPLYSFDPNCEFWMQFEFAGLTLAAARDLIDSRNHTAKR